MAIRFSRPLVLFTPSDLGASLLAWWDAERADLITAPGGFVSSWRDIVAGYDLAQATGTAQPALSGGYVIPDGVDDLLALAPVPAAIPIGATGCIMWAGCNQTVAPANATAMSVLCYGSSSAFHRLLRRTVSGGLNIVSAAVGNGTAQVGAQLNGGDFSGKHCAALVIDGANIAAELDGVASPSAACVPGTTNTRLHAFASTNSVAGSAFANIPTRLLMITRADLTAGQKAQMTAYIRGRL